MNDPYEAFDSLLPHLEAVGWSLTSTKTKVSVVKDNESQGQSVFPSGINELLKTIIKGLPRAMYPLSHRRKNLKALDFADEYDLQDLLHSLLRPWVLDIRPEEFTPSVAGASTRMDFLLPTHSIVIETKIIRNKSHAKKVGDELIIDIAHYRAHPKCKVLWCVVYDPNLLLPNPKGLINDLEGPSEDARGKIDVIVKVV